MADAGHQGRRPSSTQRATRRADVASTDGRIVGGRAPTSTAATIARRRRLRASRPASSTSTPTCASPARRRPRRSRPAAGPPRSAASPRSSPCPTPTPAIDSRGVVREVLDARPARRAVRRARGRGHHRRPGGRAAGAAGRDGRARRAALHRRRHRRAGRPPDAPGAGVRRAASASSLAQHCEDDGLAAGRRTCTRGSGRAASASPASRPRPRS